MKLIVFAAAVVGAFGQSCFSDPDYVDQPTFVANVPTLLVEITNGGQTATNITYNVNWPVFEGQVNHTSPIDSGVNKICHTNHKLVFRSTLGTGYVEEILPDSDYASCTGNNVDGNNGICNYEECGYTLSHQWIHDHTPAVVDNTVKYELCTYEYIAAQCNQSVPFITHCHALSLHMQENGTVFADNNLAHVDAITFKGYEGDEGSCMRRDAFSLYVPTGTSFKPASFTPSNQPEMEFIIKATDTSVAGTLIYHYEAETTVDCCSCCEDQDKDTTNGRWKNRCTYPELSVNSSSDDGSALGIDFITFQIDQYGEKAQIKPISYMCSGHNASQGLNCLDTKVYAPGFHDMRLVITIDSLIDTFVFSSTLITFMHCGYSNNEPQKCEDLSDNLVVIFYQNGAAVPNSGFTMLSDLPFKKIFTVGVTNFRKNRIKSQAYLEYSIVKSVSNRRRRLLVTEITDSSGEIRLATSNNVALEQEAEASMAFSHSCSMAVLIVAVAAIIF